MEQRSEFREYNIQANISALTVEDWTELESISDEVNSHQEDFLELVPPVLQENGVTKMGYVISAPIVDRTMDYFYDKNLVVPFDWISWKEGHEILNRTGEDKYDDVSLEDTLKLFSAVMRSDRFNEGSFARWFESGDAKQLLTHLLSFKSIAEKEN